MRKTKTAMISTFPHLQYSNKKYFDSTFTTDIIKCFYLDAYICLNYKVIMVPFRLILFYSQGLFCAHGKPGKSLNRRISFSRPGKSWNLRTGLNFMCVTCGYVFESLFF